MSETTTTSNEADSTYSQTETTRNKNKNENENETENVLRRVQPTIKPVLIRLGLVILVSLLVITVLFTNPTLIGSRDMTNVALLVVQLLAIIAVIRLLVRILVLRRTEYIIKPGSVKRSYDLLMRSNERQIPFSLVRSHEFNQSRTENLLGHGTIILNQGLGDLKLQNIPEPEDVYAVIREQTQN